MADTPVLFSAPTGLTLTLELYLRSDPDTLVASAAATEYTNAKMWYTATFSDAIVGKCNAVIKEGSNYIGTFSVSMRDTTDLHEEDPIQTLLQWLRAFMLRAPVDATAVEEINATGGTWDTGEHSLQTLSEDAGGGFDEIEELVQGVKDKTDLLRSGQTVRAPYIAVNGLVEIIEGYDYDSTGGTAITISEASEGEWNETALALGLEFGFRFHARHTKSNHSLDVAAELTSVGTGTSDVGEFTVEIAREDLPGKLEDYKYEVYALGSADADAKRYAIVGGMLEVERGKTDD